MLKKLNLSLSLIWLKEALIVAGILAALTLGFFWQVILAGAWMPAGGGDLVPFLYPNYHFAAYTLRAGIIPLWNPHLYGGVPFAADPQSGLFYPPNLVIFLAPFDITVRTLQYLAIFHFWLAGWGMYLFLRHSPLAQKVGIPPLAALTGAIAFEFSDLFIVHFGNLNMIAVAAWLPLVLLTYQKGLTLRRVRWVAGSGALLGVATLASHIQITLFIALTLALYTLWDIGTRWIDEPTAKMGPRLKPIAYLVLAVGVMIGLSALWLIPTLEMSRHTLRAQLAYPEAAAYALHPAQLIGLFIPNYFGRDPALHWGPWQRVETGYIGLLTLFLAAVGLILYRGKEARFMAGLAVISFLLALGDNAILHGWLSLSPGFGQFRAPARYILLLDFALAALAAVGLACLMTPLTEAAHRHFSKLLATLSWVLGGLIIVSLPLAYYALLITQDRHPDIFLRAQGATTGVTTFAILSLVSFVFLHLVRTNRLRQGAVGLGAALIIGLDLFSLGATVDVGYNNPTTGFYHPEAVAFLQENGGLNRVEVTTDVWHLWQPDMALLHRLYDAWGIYNPLTLAGPTTYWGQIWPRASHSYNLLGIKYIIASKAGAPGDGDIVPIFENDPTINIYLNRQALPRFLFVNRAVVVQTQEEAWQQLKSSHFDPTQTVILDAAAGDTATLSVINPPGEVAPLAPPNTAPSLNVQTYDLHTLEIAVTVPTAGYLVISDTYYPGWGATIDGEPVPLYRANYAFRAVPVPAGSHLVRLDFKPISWWVGLTISGLTVLGLSILFFKRGK